VGEQLGAGERAGGLRRGFTLVVRASQNVAQQHAGVVVLCLVNKPPKQPLNSDLGCHLFALFDIEGFRDTYYQIASLKRLLSPCSLPQQNNRN